MKSFKRPTRIFKYVIPGEPIPLAKVAEAEGPSQWNEYKQLRFNYTQTVKNQHEKYFNACCFEDGARNPRQYIDGPIKLEAIFYMKNDTNKKEGVKEHTTTPPANTLFNFVDYVLEGIIYKKDCVIASVKIDKLYDDMPRTEITIIRLINEKKSNKK